MKYTSRTAWRDLTDNHLYQQGDPFPHDGREISDDRINALVSGNNQAGIALLTAVEDVVDKDTTKASEPPKTVKKGRKKTV